VALGWRSGIGRPPTRELWVGVANGVLPSPARPKLKVRRPLPRKFQHLSEGAESSLIQYSHPPGSEWNWESSNSKLE